MQPSPHLCVLVACVLACSSSCARPSAHQPPPPTPLSLQAGARGALPWAEFSAATFARARAERKLIVLDGAAEWCHWCHVMEAETYRDPRVRAALDRSFIVAKVDVDARPDIEERYGDYGWPATVIFSPDGEELGKYRGFLDAERFLEILAAAVAGQPDGGPARVRVATAPAATAGPASPSRELVDWIAHAVASELEDYWDPAQGGWGLRQKAPIGANNAWLLARAARGDAEARRRALLTLDRQAQLLDPVWGGIYQYSEGGGWDRPHFEKLMTYQAPALDNYARAYQLTGDPAQLARARAVVGYLERFLKNPRGTFGATQDADLNAHQPERPFLAGREYYALDERARLALGVPRVDTHEYGEENGLAIAAYVTYFEVTREPAALAAAERAAAQILEGHADARGGITHDVRKADSAHPEILYLADNAAFGLALMRLHEVTGKASYLDAAARLGTFLLTELRDERSGAFFASTRDPAAVGVFATRRVPFEDNVRALRFLVRLSAADAAARAALAPHLGPLVRAVTDPPVYKAATRFLGELLLALDELRQAG